MTISRSLAAIRTHSTGQVVRAHRGMASTARPRFAPLGASDNDSDGTSLRGIVFDMDGTMCEPQNYMFGQMRSALGIDKSEDILDHIYALPEDEQPAAHEKIEKIEREAMAKQVPQRGLSELLAYLDKKGIRKGVCTRNFDTPVTHLLTHHIPKHIAPFHPVITRAFKPPKPSPAGILSIASQWGISVPKPAEQTGFTSRPAPIPLIMVGDSIDDIVAGFDAGAATVLVKSEGKEELETDPRTDVVIQRLDELIVILENGFTPRSR